MAPGLAIATTIVFMTGACRGGVGTLGSRQRTIAALIAAAVAVLTACSFDYSDAGVSAEQLRDNVPETDLTDVTHIIVRDGRVVAEVTATRVQNYRNRGLTIFDNVRYTEYDRTGTPVTTGSAERAVYYPEEPGHRSGGGGPTALRVTAGLGARRSAVLAGRTGPAQHSAGAPGGDSAR